MVLRRQLGPAQGSPRQPPPRQRFDGQGLGEVVHLILRPDWRWYLLSSWRLVLLVLVFVGIYFLGRLLGALGVPTLIFWVVLIPISAIVVGGELLVDINTLFFRRYILTDWRLIDDQGIIYELRIEAALERIQYVRVVHHNPLEMWFDIGDIEVRTAGRKGMMLQGILHPREVVDRIRTEQINKGSKYYAQPIAPRHPALASLWDKLEADDDPAPTPPVADAHVIKHLPFDLAPREYVLRSIRRHWFLLVVHARIWLLIGAVLLGLAGLYRLMGNPLMPWFPRWTFALGIAFPLIGLGLAWLNWADDYLVFTTRRIIDLERAYFIFADSAAETTYRRVQDVSVELPPIGQLFGYGTIRIETAGVADDIVLEYMPHVIELQDYIYERIDYSEGGKERLLRSIRRREFRRWFGMMINEMVADVPDVRGMTLVEAAGIVRAAGLRLTVSTQRAVAGTPAGVVLQQSPNEGATAMRGSEIAVTVSGVGP